MIETKRRLTVNNPMDCRAPPADGSHWRPSTWVTVWTCVYVDDRIIVRFHSPARVVSRLGYAPLQSSVRYL